MAMKARYSFGGDEHVFVEVDEEMSLEAFFKSLSMTNAVRESRIKGVTEICPANASLQIRFDPDLISPQDMLAELKRLEFGGGKVRSTLKTRIVEIPVYYNDPWTHETLMRFRERHQEPESTDLEYAAKINGYGDMATSSRRIPARRGSFQWSASSPACRSCTRWSSGRSRSRSRNISARAPTRPSSRSDTAAVSAASIPSEAPAATRCSASRRCPSTIRSRKCHYLRDFMIFFKPGDIVKFKPVDRDGYDAAVEWVDKGTFDPPIRPVTFSLDEFHADPAATNAKIWGRSMALEFVKPGLSTTVQDLGRPGYYHLGIPESGGMDRYSLAAANLLVGNPENAAVLEAVFQGPEVRVRARLHRRCDRRRNAAEGRWRRAAGLDIVRDQGRPDAFLWLSQARRARLYRLFRRRRRAGGARIALDLSARRARRP